MIGQPSQIPFDLPLRSANGREDFLIAACNEAAVAWIDRYPEWKDAIAVLRGPSASGKSHLMAVWSTTARAVWLNGPDIRVADLADRIQDAKAVAVDDADQCVEPDCLFHLVNMMRERRGHLLIAVREPPARWTFGTADMRSRLAAVPLLELGAPDDDILQAVLVKQFDDRGIQIAPQVVRSLLTWMPRTFDAARALVGEIDRLSLASKRKPSAQMVRPALANLGFLDENEQS